FTRMQVDEAMAEAEKHGIFTSTYVEEILNRRHPSQVGFRSFDEDMEKPKGFSIGELDPGDPGHYDGIFNEKGKEEVDGR
ncbi:MAG: hypothetical protein L0213_03975, partial [Candidatus Dadabacteria bacterium]|nr:hypothetical protein [Candidatus Dadabacteria bacterium]